MKLYIQQQSQSSTVILTQSLRGSHAAAALLECLSESIFYRCQLPKTKLEALDRIQNKELFIIIYTKLVGTLKKKLRFKTLLTP